MYVSATVACTSAPLASSTVLLVQQAWQNIYKHILYLYEIWRIHELWRLGHVVFISHVSVIIPLHLQVRSCANILQDDLSGMPSAAWRQRHSWRCLPPSAAYALSSVTRHLDACFTKPEALITNIHKTQTLVNVATKTQLTYIHRTHKTLILMHRGSLDLGSSCI